MVPVAGPRRDATMNSQLKQTWMVAVVLLGGVLLSGYAQDLAANGSACSASWEPPWKGTMATGGTPGTTAAIKVDAGTKDPAGILGKDPALSDSVDPVSPSKFPGWLMIGGGAFLGLLAFLGVLELIKRSRGKGSRYSSRRSTNFPRSR